jgi:hypothetical protein
VLDQRGELLRSAAVCYTPASHPPEVSLFLFVAVVAAMWWAGLKGMSVLVASVDSLESPISSCALDGQRRSRAPNQNETGTRSSDTNRRQVDFGPVIDTRGRLLVGALGFACSMPSYGRALHTLGAWLDSWAGIGRIAVGMARQGVRPSTHALRRARPASDHGALAYERGHRVGAHALARDAAGGVGGAQTRECRCLTIGRSRRTGPLRASLGVPNVEASDVELQSLWEVGTDALHDQVILRDRFPASVTRFFVGGTAEDLRAITAWQNPAREPVPDARP